MLWGRLARQYLTPPQTVPACSGILECRGTLLPSTSPCRQTAGVQKRNKRLGEVLAPEGSPHAQRKALGRTGDFKQSSGSIVLPRREPPTPPPKLAPQLPVGLPGKACSSLVAPGPAFIPLRGSQHLVVAQLEDWPPRKPACQVAVGPLFYLHTQRAHRRLLPTQ